MGTIEIDTSQNCVNKREDGRSPAPARETVSPPQKKQTKENKNSQNLNYNIRQRHTNQFERN